MAETAPAPPPPPAESAAKKKQPKKAAGASKSRPAKSGPSVSDLIVRAVSASKERSGVSLSALKKALAAGGYDVEKNNSRLKLALKGLVSKETLIQLKGSGASGSFKLNKKQLESKEKAARKQEAGKPKKPAARKQPAKKPAARKQPAKSPKKPKKAPAGVKKSPKKVKKPAAAKKAAKSPKKSKVAKPKKAVKSPVAKKVAKPKAAKSPAKAKAAKPKRAAASKK
ncbi:histone H1-like [Ascaphus truei]|uniref:histone H1-like n=1 Tax=Ascaphus truei TaxID=8439 RepID=UPI003F59DB52